jgi:hypothetical protein
MIAVRHWRSQSQLRNLGTRHDVSDQKNWGRLDISPQKKWGDSSVREQRMGKKIWQFRGLLAARIRRYCGTPREGAGSQTLPRTVPTPV